MFRCFGAPNSVRAPKAAGAQTAQAEVAAVPFVPGRPPANVPPPPWECRQVGKTLEPHTRFWGGGHKRQKVAGHTSGPRSLRWQAVCVGRYNPSAHAGVVGRRALCRTGARLAWRAAGCNPVVRQQPNANVCAAVQGGLVGLHSKLADCCQGPWLQRLLPSLQLLADTLDAALVRWAPGRKCPSCTAG